MKSMTKLLFVYVSVSFLTYANVCAITGSDIAGGLLKGTNSLAGLLLFMNNLDQLNNQLRVTEANLKAAVSELKKDARVFVQANKEGNDKAKLAASRKFLFDMARMQAVGGFLEYTVDTFDFLGKAMSVVPGASGKIKSIADQIESYKNEMSVVWKMAALMAKSMSFHCTDSSAHAEPATTKSTNASKVTSTPASEADAEKQLEELVF